VGAGRFFDPADPAAAGLDLVADLFDAAFLGADFFDAAFFFGAAFFTGDFFAGALFFAAAFLGADLFEAAFFFGAAFFVVDFFAAAFFVGTFAPFFLASESPMAIACLRLVTFLPEPPLRKVPFFILFTADSTPFPAPLEYFAMMIWFSVE
jgi:hypothetical protein